MQALNIDFWHPYYEDSKCRKLDKAASWGSIVFTPKTGEVSEYVDRFNIFQAAETNSGIGENQQSCYFQKLLESKGSPRRLQE